MALIDLVSRASNRGGGSGGGATDKNKSSTTGKDPRVQVRYDSHLPILSLLEGENSRSILAGMVLRTLHSAVIFKN